MDPIERAKRCREHAASLRACIAYCSEDPTYPRHFLKSYAESADRADLLAAEYEREETRAA